MTFLWVPNTSVAWRREVSVSGWCIWVPYLGDLNQYSSFWGQKDEEGEGYEPIGRVRQRNTSTTNDGGTKRG
jgi:hypothetical protein